MIQREASDNIPCDLDLLGQCLLIPEHLLHHFIPQIHLGFQALLIDSHRIHPGEEQVKILIDLIPALILA